MAYKPLCVTHVYDFGENQLDRYTLYLNWEKNNDGTHQCLCLSGNPTHPQGFSQFSSGVPGKHNGRRIRFEDLPENIQSHAAYRLSDDEED